MTDYYYKYLKYKSKYLNLVKNIKIIDDSSNETIVDCKQNKEDIPIENILVGGTQNIIIHISGASGAGKTTLGNKLKYRFEDKIVVMDLDILRYYFVKKEYGGFSKFKFNKNDKFDKDKYQKWIDSYIKKQIKPIVFVGLNHMPWWHKNFYYNMHSNYNFYIKLDADTIFKQKCNRFIDQTFIENKNRMFKNIMKNENKTIKFVSNTYKQECSYQEVKKLNKMWNKDYKKQGYVFLPREKIYEKVCNILESIL
jgi:adenylate kinase family enzyme